MAELLEMVDDAPGSPQWELVPHSQNCSLD